MMERRIIYFLTIMASESVSVRIGVWSLSCKHHQLLCSSVKLTKQQKKKAVMLAKTWQHYNLYFSFTNTLHCIRWMCWTFLTCCLCSGKDWQREKIKKKQKTKESFNISLSDCTLFFWSCWHHLSVIYVNVFVCVCVCACEIWLCPSGTQHLFCPPHPEATSWARKEDCFTIKLKNTWVFICVFWYSIPSIVQ